MPRTTVRIVNTPAMPSCLYVYGEWFAHPDDRRVADMLAVIAAEEPGTRARIQTRGLDSGDWK